MSRRQVRIAADIPKDSRLYRAIQKEQELTGRNVTDIVRDALVKRYDIRVKSNDGNHKEEASED